MLKLIQRLGSLGCDSCGKGFLPIHSSRSLLKQCRKMSDAVIVRTAQGDVRGKKSLSKVGTTFHSFQGLPYAKPPLGQLRFLSPQPHEPWTGVRDALAEGNVCLHKDPFSMTTVGDEDCLFLNVFTPQSNGPPRAVMVFFHGGGYQVGSGNSEMYGPDFLVAQDIVLVTLNFRLGVFGFLSLEEAGVSGNAGLKDQVAALKWVQQNIAAFGGDPNNVTIFGESAGAACVQLHLLSPMSEGLFHKAIGQSGTALSWWSSGTTASSISRAFTLGKLLGCDADQPRQLVDFLREQPAEKLSKLASKTVPPEMRARGDLFPFVPTVERGSGSEVFLPDRPLTLLKSGKIAQVPYILGINSHEGMLMLREILANPSKWLPIDRDFENLMISLDLNVQLHTEKAKEVAHKIKSYYFQGRPVNHETRVEYANLITDFWFGYGVDTGVKLHALRSSAPVFYYQFSYDGAFNLFKRVMGFEDMPGACHADELGYLFSNDFIDYDSTPESPEMKVLHRFVKMWADFAKTGKPTTDPSQWPAYTEKEAAYLDIDAESSVGYHRLADRMNFWAELYQQTGTIYDSNTSKL